MTQKGLGASTTRMLVVSVTTTSPRHKAKSLKNRTATFLPLLRESYLTNKQMNFVQADVCKGVGANSEWGKFRSVEDWRSTVKVE